MSLIDWILLAAVAAAAAGALLFLRRNRRKGRCSCGCEHCSGCR